MTEPPDPSFLIGRHLIAFHVATRMIEFFFGARPDEEFRANEVVTLMSDYSFKTHDGDWVRKEEAVFEQALMTFLDHPVIAARISQAWDLELDLRGGSSLILHATPPYESYVLNGVYVIGPA